jgi:uncharacterized DUF497 family protein
MKIEGFVWLDQVENKLAGKHGVSIEEVEEVFTDKPQFRFVEKGHRKGEDVYMALGTTEAGRYRCALHPQVSERSFDSKRQGHGDRRKEVL